MGFFGEVNGQLLIAGEVGYFCPAHYQGRIARSSVGGAVEGLDGAVNVSELEPSIARCEVSGGVPGIKLEKFGSRGQTGSEVMEGHRRVCQAHQCVPARPLRPRSRPRAWR